MAANIEDALNRHRQTMNFYNQQQQAALNYQHRIEQLGFRITY